MAPESAAGGLGESTDEPLEVGRPPGSYRREDVSFSSAGDLCAGWLYIPQGLGPHPAVILAHGLGGQRRFRLDAYGERFAEAGLAALVFDYRHFAESDGEPRQLVSIGRQLEDWRAALRFARGHSLVAPRIALWGTSLSAGHVQAIAAEDHEIAAVIAQVPLVNGRSVARTVGPRQAIRLIWAAYRDRLRALLGRDAYRIPIWGPPGTLAAMTAPGAAEAIRTKLLPPGDWDETMPARILGSPIHTPSPLT